MTTSVGPTEPVTGQASIPVYADNKAAEAQSIARAAAQANAPAAEPAQARPAPAADAHKAAGPGPTEINVRFRIDEKTRDVTVFMLNRATREVIRTIPPSELAKLTPGDIVNLFA